MDVVPASWLYELWCRGCAVQCSHNQPVIDGFFVTYEHDGLDTDFDERKLSLGVWQFKLKDEAASHATVDGTTCPRILLKTGQIIKPRHLVLFMDLGSNLGDIQAEKDTGQAYFQLKKRKAVRPKNTTWSGFTTDSNNEPEAFCLNIRGHSAEQYKCLLDANYNLQTQVDTLCRLIDQTPPAFATISAKFQHSLNHISQVPHGKDNLTTWGV